MKKLYISIEEFEEMGNGSNVSSSSIVVPEGSVGIDDVALDDQHELIEEHSAAASDIVTEFSTFQESLVGLADTANTADEYATHGDRVASLESLRIGIDRCFGIMDLDPRNYVASLESLTVQNVSTEGLTDFIKKAVHKIVDAFRKVMYKIKESFSHLFVGFSGIRERAVELLDELNRNGHLHTHEDRSFSASGWHRLHYQGRVDKVSVLEGLAQTHKLLEHTSHTYVPAMIHYYEHIGEIYKGANKKINEYIAHSPALGSGGGASGGGNTTIIIGGGNTVDNSNKGGSSGGASESRRLSAMWRFLSHDIEEGFVAANKELAAKADVTTEASCGFKLTALKDGTIGFQQKTYASVAAKQNSAMWSVEDLTKALHDVIAICDFVDDKKIHQLWDAACKTEETAYETMYMAFGEMYDDARQSRDEADGRIATAAANQERINPDDLSQRDNAERAIRKFEEVLAYVDLDPFWGLYKFHESMYRVVRGVTRIAKAAINA
jgi:hypothetical protein